MNLHKDKKFINLVKNQRFAVIATNDKDEPYTNLVSFMISEDLKKIFFPTSKNTKKFQNISKNSKISILIDNRGNNPEDIKNAIVVTAVGTSSQIIDEKIIYNFLKKHPYLKDFIKSKDCAMIKIDIEKYVIVDNFENVNIINFSVEK